ncbi:MAG: serine hydrolase [Saprospiraceae bacterium]|nr:serine hydrolase [Lewinella sp.]
MKNSLQFILAISLLLLPLFQLPAQSLEQQLDRILAEYVSPSTPGVTALVAKEGKILFRKSRGMSNLEFNTPMQSEQIFRIGSLTKQFTATAILKLAEENKLSLQDDIRRYIGDFLPGGAPISIENLLTHTSGIKNYTQIANWEKAVEQTDLSPEQLIDIFKNEPLAFQPGEQFMYSNLGYNLLGYIIESVSGLPFANYLQQTFFTPLGMQQTSYATPQTTHIQGYSKRNGHYSEAADLDMKLPYAAGGLLSSVDDQLTWYQAIFDHKVLQEASLERAHRAFLLKNGRPIPYGYGWRIGSIQGAPSIKHDGIINGFVTFVIYLPVQQIFVALFSNCDCHVDIEEPASKMAAVMLGKPYENQSVQLSQQELMAFQGIYQSPEGHEKYITFQDGQLMYHDKGGSKVPLLAVADGQFTIGESLTFLTFSGEAAEKNIIFTMESTGLPTQWRRVADIPTAFQSISMSSQNVEKFLGKYQFPGAFTLEVTRSDDKIYGQVGPDKKEIRPFEKDKFFAVDTDIKLIFDMNTNGDVSGLTLVQNMEMQAKKIE